MNGLSELPTTPTELSAELSAGSPLVTLTAVYLTLTSAAGPVPVLRGIDLQVEAGEVLGIVGPSGSGKTTLMMAIAGLERISAGSLKVAGYDLPRLDEDALAHYRNTMVGIVFQGFHLVPTMTALENVALPLELAGRDDAFAEAARGLEAVGLRHRTHHYPAQLSGGEQQRVALARAMAGWPPLLLADEPTGNLDGATGRLVIDHLFTLTRNHGSALILVTHDTELAARCHRVVHLADGRIREENRIQEPIQSRIQEGKGG